MEFARALELFFRLRFKPGALLVRLRIEEREQMRDIPVERHLSPEGPEVSLMPSFFVFCSVLTEVDVHRKRMLTAPDDETQFQKKRPVWREKTPPKKIV